MPAGAIGFFSNNFETKKKNGGLSSVCMANEDLRTR
jgi:hypothetical protein